MFTYIDRVKALWKRQDPIKRTHLGKFFFTYMAGYFVGLFQMKVDVFNGIWKCRCRIINSSLSPAVMKHDQIPADKKKQLQLKKFNNLNQFP